MTTREQQVQQLPPPKPEYETYIVQIHVQRVDGIVVDHPSLEVTTKKEQVADQTPEPTHHQQQQGGPSPSPALLHAIVAVEENNEYQGMTEPSRHFVPDDEQSQSSSTVEDPTLFMNESSYSAVWQGQNSVSFPVQLRKRSDRGGLPTGFNVKTNLKLTVCLTDLTGKKFVVPVGGTKFAVQAAQAGAWCTDVLSLREYEGSTVRFPFLQEDVTGPSIQSFCSLSPAASVTVNVFMEAQQKQQQQQQAKSRLKSSLLSPTVSRPVRRNERHESVFRKTETREQQQKQYVIMITDSFGSSVSQFQCPPPIESKEDEPLLLQKQKHSSPLCCLGTLLTPWKIFSLSSNSNERFVKLHADEHKDKVDRPHGPQSHVVPQNIIDDDDDDDNNDEIQYLVQRAQQQQHQCMPSRTPMLLRAPSENAGTPTTVLQYQQNREGMTRNDALNTSCVFSQEESTSHEGYSWTSASQSQPNIRGNFMVWGNDDEEEEEWQDPWGLERAKSWGSESAARAGAVAEITMSKVSSFSKSVIRNIHKHPDDTTTTCSSSTADYWMSKFSHQSSTSNSDNNIYSAPLADNEVENRSSPQSSYFCEPTVATKVGPVLPDSQREPKLQQSPFSCQPTLSYPIQMPSTGGSFLDQLLPGGCENLTPHVEAVGQQFSSRPMSVTTRADDNGSFLAVVPANNKNE